MARPGQVGKQIMIWSVRLRGRAWTAGRTSRWADPARWAPSDTICATAGRASKFAWVDAAIDALKKLHGFKRLHAVGQSGARHTVAAVLQHRGDLGCAVISAVQ